MKNRFTQMMILQPWIKERDKIAIKGMIKEEFAGIFQQTSILSFGPKLEVLQEIVPSNFRHPSDWYSTAAYKKCPGYDGGKDAVNIH